MTTRRSRSFVALAAALTLQAGAGLVAALAPATAVGAATAQLSATARHAAAIVSNAPARAGAGIPLAANAVASASPVWTLETTPLIGTGSQLNAVRCSTGSSCIAVGFQYVSGTTAAVAESWNGTAWSQMVLPLPSGSHASDLTGLSCPSPTSCMAVGYWQNGSVVDLTLAEAWNGRAWSVVPTPSVVNARLTDFTGLSCATTSACEAVGYYQTTGNAMSFAESWNGRTWTGQTTPNPAGAKLAQLQGIACASSTSCEAVGNYTNSGNVEVTLAEGWNGSGWSIQATPALAGAAASAFGGVSCPSTTVCTAVGNEVGTGGEVPLAESWNGRGWSVQGTPHPSASLAAVLTGVSCATTNTCTAVGWYTDTAKVTLTLAMGWNGASWSAETTADTPGAPESYLAGVACAVAAFCSAVGNQTDTKGHQALAEQWVAARIATRTTVASTANPAVSGETVTLLSTVTPTAGGAGIVGGTVTFTNEGAPLDCNGRGDVVVVANGKANCAISGGFPKAASHPVDAVYGGNDLLVGSTGTIVETVARDNTTSSVSSSVNPAVTGQSVTFSVVVKANAPGSGTATGVATFTIGTAGAVCNGGDSDAVALDAGRASCTVVGPIASATAYAVKVAYGGDANYDSSSTALSETVHPGASTTAIGSSSDPSVTGQAVTFTATVAAVAPASGTPTGTLTFSVTSGDVTLSCANGNTVALAGGTATCTVGGLAPPGSPYSVAATYSGGQGFTSSTHSTTQQVGDGSTTTSVSSSANPSVAGQSVTFTATVVPVAPAAGVPSGTVTFAVGSGNIVVNCRGGNTVTLVAGVATCVVPGLKPAAGGYSVSATYGGDTGFTGSSQSLTQAVGTGNATIGLASTVDPSVSGQSVTFTATVAPVAPATGAPTGTVTFAVTNVVGGAVACAAGNAVTLSGGTATCTITGVAAQSAYSVHATYGGDSNFSGATATPISQTVSAGATRTTLGSSLNPTVTGQNVTFTATLAVVAPATGTPTGTVTFAVTNVAGGAVPCVGGNTVSLSGSTATCTISGAASQSAYTVHATYNGDANFAGSSAAALTQTVNVGGTSTSLRSSLNPSSSGQSVTFTAAVAVVGPAAGTPGGSVTFTVAGTAGAAACAGGNTVTISGGSATCTITGESGQSAYTVRATYNGDANFAGSTAAALTQTVTAGATSTVLTSTANPAVTGQPVTLVATVSATGIPTGSVTFTVNGAQLNCGGSGSGVVSLSAGRASCALAGMDPASFTAVATYGGDANYSGSTSGGLTETVDQDATIVTISSDANPTVYGELYDLTATVSAATPGAGTPTGTVTFFVNGAQVCDDGTDTFTLSGGQATCPIQFYEAAGTYSVTATYSGDANFVAPPNGSVPFTQTVDEDPTTTAETVSSNPTNAGINVIYTAVVSGTSPGAASPPAGDSVVFTATNQSTGAVIDLNCGGTGSDSVQIAFVSGPNQNEALCYAAISVVGTYTVSAAYVSDGNFLASTGSLTETVNGN